MTREEAIEYAESKKMRLEALVYNDDCKYGNYAMYSGELSFVNAALAALRPVSREQVEKARWIKIYEDGEPAIEQHQIGVACSKCMNMPKDRFTESKFCPNCGRPMTDEAVEIVVERLEALHDKNV